MSEHSVHVNWVKKTAEFSYETFDRTHEIIFEGGSKILASSAPQYSGKKEFVNPEEQLASAVASCHMLTFLAVAAKSRLTVESYADHATAILDKNAQGKMCVTKIILRPQVVFSGLSIPDAAKLKDLHDKAHRNCFIANSVSCQIEIQ